MWDRSFKQSANDLQFRYSTRPLIGREALPQSKLFSCGIVENHENTSYENWAGYHTPVLLIRNTEPVMELEREERSSCIGYT